MKKLLTILLCLAMLFALACGCGNQETEPTDAPEAEKTEAPADKDDSQPTEAPAENNGEEPASGENVYPLTGDNLEITYWYEMSPQVVAYLEDTNDDPTWQEIEKNTGVHVEFQTVSDGTAEKFNIMISSGEACDVMVYGGNYYPGGLGSGVEDGVFMELTDVIDQYMPAYKAIRESSPDVMALTTLTDGKSIGGIYSMYHEPMAAGTGPIVRKDWLDKLGIDPTSIQTYDDYHNMLTAFKTEMGATSAVYMPAVGCPMGNYLSAGYGIAAYSDMGGNTVPFYQVNGEVQYGYTQAVYKDYLTMINQWYTEGLFNSDFVNNTNALQISPEDVTDGSTGLWWHMSQIMEEHQSQAVQEDFESCAIADAVMEVGDKTHLSSYSTSIVSNIHLCFSADCDNIEVAAKWVDYFFTEEGSIVASYGVEGLTFDYDENGEPHFTDLIINNPDHGMIVASNIYAIQNAVMYEYETRFYDGYSESAKEAGNIWMSTLDTDDMYTIPEAVQITGEDATTYSNVYADINTYALENIPKFIMGERSLDEFDDFVAQIEDLGIETCVQLWQKAYDAYKA